MAARLLGWIRRLTEFLEILHSVRDDGQVSYFSPGKGPFKLTLLGPWKFKAVNCSSVIYLLRSGAHRFLLRYKAILFTDLTEKFEF